MNPARRLSRSTAVQVALRQSLWSGMGSTWRLLPRSFRGRLAFMAPVADRLVAPSTRMLFENRPIALADWKPIFAAADFAAGPIVLVNSALTAGGAERQVVNTLLALDRRGLRCGLLCLRLHDEPLYDFFVPALAGFSGFARNVMPLKRAEPILSEMIGADAAARLLAATAWLPRYIQDQVICFCADFASLKPCVVHAWQDGTGIVAGFAARLVGVPRIVVSSRNLAPTNFAYFQSYMEYAYREIASCQSIKMVNNSAAGARSYVDWLGLPHDRFIVKRNGVDVTAMKRAPADAVAALRERLKIPAGAKVVGSIFRFYPEKQPLLWVETAARIVGLDRSCHFVVFGEGPLHGKAVALARRLACADRLHFPGNIENTGLGLSLLDVFLLTSKFEGTPNVVLEASALGVPVVTTDAGGAAEAVEENVTGYVADADPERLAQQVLAILRDDAWAARVKTEGPKFITGRFGLDRMLDETLALYGLPATHYEGAR